MNARGGIPIPSHLESPARYHASPNHQQVVLAAQLHSVPGGKCVGWGEEEPVRLMFPLPRRRWEVGRGSVCQVGTMSTWVLPT